MLSVLIRELGEKILIKVFKQDKSYYFYKIIVTILLISLYPLSIFIDYIFQNNLISQNKKIDLNVSVQSETSNGREFWWLTDETTYLSVINKAPYDVTANVILKLEENPCGEILKFSIKNENKELYNNFNYDPSNFKFLNINLPIQIKRFESINLKLEPKDQVYCRVNNGDQRKFIAKITQFRIESN